ncbi:uncharacterized protein [Nicotiana tomentosiformis]|uniref:uncharacterized protein n=1 Tax=Nicotiana tomentosiformis TaxID=4098 RepID=UPI00388C9598
MKIDDLEQKNTTTTTENSQVSFDDEFVKDATVTVTHQQLLVLTGTNNFSLWYRSMRIALLGRYKLGIMDGRWKKERFPLNDSYSQARSQVLMMKLVPSVNQAYAMLVSDESQRVVAATVGILDPLSNLHIGHYESTFKFNLLSMSNIIKELWCLVAFYHDFCIFEDLFNGRVKVIGRDYRGLHILPSWISSTVNKQTVEVSLEATKNKDISTKETQTQFNKQVKCVRSDNEAKFVNSICDTLFKRLGIVHQRFCVYNPQDVSFIEDIFPFQQHYYKKQPLFLDTSSFSLPSPIEEWSAQDTLEVSSHNSDDLVGFSSPTNSDSSNVSELPAYEPTDTTVSPFSSPALRRSSRDKHPPLWIMEFVSINEIKYPRWVDAMKFEIVALEDNHTWDIIALLSRKKTIECKWVYMIKYKASGKIDRFKASSLYCCYPTLAYSSDGCVQFFPTGGIYDEIYMELSLGFAPRQRNAKLSKVVLHFGFTHSQYDHSLFINKRSGSDLMFFLVYFNDMMITGSRLLLITEAKIALQQTFKMKDLGELRYFLGIEFARSKKGILMYYRKYTLKFISDLGRGVAKATATPLEQMYCQASQKLAIKVSSFDTPVVSEPSDSATPSGSALPPAPSSSTILNDGAFVYLLLYVDDMLISAKDLIEIHNLKSQLKSEFEMKDLGAAKKILGMEIKRDRKANRLFLT